MDANNIYNPVYRQDYFKGYSHGQNPSLHLNNRKKSDAYTSGFLSGRLDYESMNGSIANGIPARIVTKKVLEDFLLAGLLGLSVDTDGYTAYQLNLIAPWYQSGTEKYDPDQSLYLFAILEQNGIEIS